MRTIGFDYVKLFTMFIFLVLASVAVVSLSGAFFAAMDLPITGMLVSIVLSSFLAFYFWVSYSAILGITRTKREAA